MASEVQGLDGLLQAMQQLPAELKRNNGPYRRALGRSARYLRDEVRKDAPTKSGFLVSQIVAMRSRKPQSYGGTELYSVGVKGGARAKYANTRRNRGKGRAGQTYTKPSNAYYWRFQEFGVPSKNIPPLAFFRRNFESKGPIVVDKFATDLRKDIDRLTKKLGKG